MSRNVKEFSEPKEFLGHKIVSVTYGLDNLCGYFIQAFTNDELVEDLDSYGYGFAGSEALKKHSNSEMMQYFLDLDMRDVADLVALDLPI